MFRFIRNLQSLPFCPRGFSGLYQFIAAAVAVTANEHFCGICETTVNRLTTGGVHSGSRLGCPVIPEFFRTRGLLGLRFR
jgi:hypothetical protein